MSSVLCSTSGRDDIVLLAVDFYACEGCDVDFDDGDYFFDCERSADGRRAERTAEYDLQTTNGKIEECVSDVRTKLR